MAMTKRVLMAVLAIPLAAFFGFVGFYKVFAPLSELLAHNAWTAHVPAWIGRPIGGTEMAGALALLAGLHPAAWRFARLSAAWLAATQIPSSLIHWTHGEQGELPKNLLIFVALCLVAWLARPVTPAKETLP